MPPTAMTQLYERAKQLGYSRPFVRGVLLPDWWDDSLGDAPAGVSEAATYISRHANVSYTWLLEGRGEAQGQANVRYKRRADTDLPELSAAQGIALSVARFAARGAPDPTARIPSNALEARAAILNLGNPWVSLPSLVEYCWSIGIAVVHLGETPNCKRMQAMAARIDGRYAIVLAENRKHPAWSLFHLAHELGHIVSGHLSEGDTLVDVQMDDANGDIEEQQANEFATCLLNGRNVRYTAAKYPLKGTSLGRVVMERGTAEQIDPGHIALNYGAAMSQFPAAQIALQAVPYTLDGPSVLREAFARHFAAEKISEEAAEFLKRATSPGTN